MMILLAFMVSYFFPWLGAIKRSAPGCIGTGAARAFHDQMPYGLTTQCARAVTPLWESCELMIKSTHKVDVRGSRVRTPSLKMSPRFR